MYNSKISSRFNELKQCEGYTVDAKGDMVKIEKYHPQIKAARQSVNKTRKMNN